jgi:hypothetical protein
MKLKTHGLLSWIAFLVTSCAATMAAAKSETLRIVTYNIEDDIGTFSGTNGIPRPGLIQPTNGSTYSGTTSDGGVLEGIGELPMGATNNVQPLDILALQETTSNSLTVAPIVSALNTYYSSPGMYAQSSVQGSQEGGSTNVGFGNGPNAIVYNTKTLQLVASVGVGTPSAVRIRAGRRYCHGSQRILRLCEPLQIGRWRYQSGEARRRSHDHP